MTAPLAVLGFGGSIETLITLVLLNIVLAYGGYIVVAGGSFSLAFVAFIGLGAYTAAILNVDHGIGIIPALAVAPVLAVLTASVLAKPLARLSGIYLALVSVAVISVFRVLLLNLDDLTGGALGKIGVTPRIGLPALGLAAGGLATLFWLVHRSMIGRAMRLVRADRLAASSLGIDVSTLQYRLFLASAAVGAVGGVLRAYYFGFVVPNEYGFHLLVILLAMVILGGVGHWSGPIVGAAVWTLLPEWLRPLDIWREVATGLILLAIIIALPQGVTGGLGDATRRLRHRLKFHGADKGDTGNEREPAGAAGDSAVQARRVAMASRGLGG